MEKTNVIVKKWGNSFGVVLPANIVKAKNLKEGSELTIMIKEKNELKRAFGSLKNWNVNAQKIKDEIRKEENGVLY